MWKCYAFARETKLEAINLCQTPLLWLQRRSAKSVEKEEQEATKKKVFFSWRQHLCSPIQHQWLLAVTKWIFCGGRISYKVHRAPDVFDSALASCEWSTLIIEFQIKFQKASKAVLPNLCGNARSEERSLFSAFSALPVKHFVFISNFPPLPFTPLYNSTLSPPWFPHHEFFIRLTARDLWRLFLAEQITIQSNLRYFCRLETVSILRCNY